MAKSDLRVLGIDCLNKNVQKRISEKHVHLACEGYGLSLSKKGRNNLMKRVELADQFVNSCEAG